MQQVQQRSFFSIRAGFPLRPLYVITICYNHIFVLRRCLLLRSPARLGLEKSYSSRLCAWTPQNDFMVRKDFKKNIQRKWKPPASN